MPSGVYKRTEEIKKILSLAHLGKKFSKEHRKNISLGNLGRKFSKKAKKKISDAQRGEKGNNWKGGRIIDGNGYILINTHKHPFRNCHNYILEHRLIIEAYLGRYLKRKERTHHIDGNPSNNKVKNLMVFISHSVHMRFHKDPKNVKREEIVFDGRKM